jgi:hypothetical protein
MQKQNPRPLVRKQRSRQARGRQQRQIEATVGGRLTQPGQRHRAAPALHACRASELRLREFVGDVEHPQLHQPRPGRGVLAAVRRVHVTARPGPAAGRRGGDPSRAAAGRRGGLARRRPDEGPRTRPLPRTLTAPCARAAWPRSAARPNPPAPPGCAARRAPSAGHRAGRPRRSFLPTAGPGRTGRARSPPRGSRARPGSRR